MPTAYKWQPIADLPADPKDLTDGELESLSRVWVSQKKELIESGALEEFEKRLRREWAIETGVIENVYTLDRGVTRTLIERGIDAALIPHGASNLNSTLVARIIQDHYDALEGMFDFVGGTRQLTTGYIKELHAALLRNQETYAVVDQLDRAFEKRLEKGQYKTEPNSPTRPDGLMHEYCPPEHVASEMDRLVAMHSDHDARAVPVDVEAAWLHHRFAQIHPFADGNGRVARAIASLVFIKADWFPLVVMRDDWSRYVETLEKADEGDLRPLVAMFVEAQRSALLVASEAAFDTRPISSTGDAIKAVRDRLMQRGQLRSKAKAWHKANDTADQLVALGKQRLEAIASQLSAEIPSHSGQFSFSVAEGTVKAIPEVGHIPDFKEYNKGLWLQLFTERFDALGLSFHALGPVYRGFIGVVAYLSIGGAEPKLIEDGTYQINHEESLVSSQARFSTWLERVIVEGLNQWRRTL